MASPNLPDNSILEVVVGAKLNGQTIQFVTHYKYEENGGGTLTVSAASTDLDVVINDTLRLIQIYCACLSSDAVPDNTYTIQAIYPTRFAKISFTNSHGALAPAGALPPGNAIAVTKRSTGATRHSHGTTHVGAVPAAWITAGVLNGGEGSTYSDLGDQIAFPVDLGLGPQSATPVILRRGSPGLSEVITSTVTQPQARTMRRRVVGRGI